jgi:hypothetical protein
MVYLCGGMDFVFALSTQIESPPVNFLTATGGFIASAATRAGM